MSHILFDNGKVRARLSGSERHHMGRLISGQMLSAFGSIGDLGSQSSWIRWALPRDHYALPLRGPQFEMAVETWLSLCGGELLVDGQKVSLVSIALNTAFAVGGMPMRLLARLHGQCELHAFIPPLAGPVIAGVIARGLASGLFREGEGWTDVADLLKKSSKRHVVTSYSACETFPGFDEAKDAAIPWDGAVAGLALEERLAITLDSLNEYSFGPGLNAFQVLAKAQAAQPEPAPPT